MKPNLNSVRDDYAIIETKTTDMTKIWKEILGESSIPSLSTPSREKLYNRFLTVFNGSLEKWQEHCRKIGSSKFLMGEKSRGGHTYQLKFWVATSQPFTETLEAGVFELDTRTNERYETFKRTSSLAEAKRKANQEKGVVQDIRNYLIENYFTAYQACFSAAEMREEEGGVVSITCKTSWAKNYVRDNLMGAINKINRMWKVSAVIV